MLLLLLLTAASLAAQTIQVQSLFQPAALSGTWKQQTGDDPRWADPGFDDAAWANIALPRPSRPGPFGVTWYRIRVELPEPLPTEALSILVGPLFPAYEIFVNGKLVGRFAGPIGDRGGQSFAQPARFDLPRESRLLIAIRSEDWQIPFGAQSASAESSKSWIGTQASLANQEAAWRLDRLRRNEPVRLIMVLVLGAAAFFILLSLWRRRTNEYLWFGLFLLQNGLFRLLQTTPEWLGSPSRETANLIGTLNGVVVLGLGLMIPRSAFGSRPNGLSWLIVAIGLAFSISLSFREILQRIPTLSPWLIFLAVLMQMALYIQLAYRAKSSASQRWPIHIAYLIFLGSNLAFYALQALGGMAYGGDSLSIVEVALRCGILVFVFALAIILNLRSAESDREKGRLAQEMAAAAEVQSLMLPGSAQSGTETIIDTVYQPASEVGGDFYQVLDRLDGSRVAIVGDVSGKGLKAAMLVSVAIGALRREKASGPGEILAGLNEALLGQGGFVTCCCIRYMPGGELTVASAGHPSPYCGGREVDLVAGLPLGIVADTEWQEAKIILPPGAQVTLVSDGVVEAENSQRELFGFDRTREMSGLSAQEIAEAARAWGQTDDITVVTIRRNL